MFAFGIILLVVCVLLVIGGATLAIFKIRNGLLSVVVALAWSFLCIFVCRNFVIDFFIIPTGSMLPTIELNDNVFGNRVAAVMGDYNVGDIVTFDSVENPSMTLIKRIVADEGQTLELKDGKLYVDGELSLTDEFAHGVTKPLSNKVQFPYTVPEGCVFCMGDNREESGDSRVFGAVPKKNITSVVFCRFLPFNRFGPID